MVLWSQRTVWYYSFQGRHGLISWYHLLNTEGYRVVLRSTRFNITLYNLMMPSLENLRLQSDSAVDTVWYHLYNLMIPSLDNIRLQRGFVVATAWYYHYFLMVPSHEYRRLHNTEWFCGHNARFNITHFKVATVWTQQLYNLVIPSLENIRLQIVSWIQKITEWLCGGQNLMMPSLKNIRLQSGFVVATAWYYLLFSCAGAMPPSNSQHRLSTHP